MNTPYSRMFAVICLAAAPLLAQEPKEAKEHPAHAEFRTLRDGILEALNKDGTEKMLSYCHPNIRFTTPDGRVHRGHDGIRSYLDEMTKGPDAYVKSFRADLSVDDLAVLYGDDMGIATGTSADQFEVKGGNKFVLHNRWSATLVKEDGKWLLANYHTASNVFDNPILNLAKQSLYWVGGIAFAVGLLVAALGSWLLRRSSAKGPA
jgi:uncharacterized protein (TIGR02246 family)